MRVHKLIATTLLTLSLASAGNVMTESMSTMEKGMNQIQKGFLNNNIDLIRSGSKLVEKGNSLFAKRNTIKEFLPENRKHMINVAENASKRLTLDINVLDLNIDNKAFINASNAYSDMLNACARCHSIIRGW